MLLQRGCVTTFLYYAVKNFYVSCSGFAPAYTISPNPASNEVTIMPVAETANSKSAPTASTGITAVNVYDQQGLLKKQQKFGNVKQAKLNVSSLRTGIYFIEIVDTNHRERHQLSVLK